MKPILIPSLEVATKFGSTAEAIFKALSETSSLEFAINHLFAVDLFCL